MSSSAKPEFQIGDTPYVVNSNGFFEAGTIERIDFNYKACEFVYTTGIGEYYESQLTFTRVRPRFSVGDKVRYEHVKDEKHITAMGFVVNGEYWKYKLTPHTNHWVPEKLLIRVNEEESSTMSNSEKLMKAAQGLETTVTKIAKQAQKSVTDFEQEMLKVAAVSEMSKDATQGIFKLCDDTQLKCGMRLHNKINDEWETVTEVDSAGMVKTDVSGSCWCFMDAYDKYKDPTPEPKFAPGEVVIVAQASSSTIEDLRLSNDMGKWQYKIKYVSGYVDEDKIQPRPEPKYSTGQFVKTSSDVGMIECRVWSYLCCAWKYKVNGQDYGESDLEIALFCKTILGADIKIGMMVMLDEDNEPGEVYDGYKFTSDMQYKGFLQIIGINMSLHGKTYIIKHPNGNLFRYTKCMFAYYYNTDEMTKKDDTEKSDLEFKVPPLKHRGYRMNDSLDALVYAYQGLKHNRGTLAGKAFKDVLDRIEKQSQQECVFTDMQEAAILNLIHSYVGDQLFTITNRLKRLEARAKHDNANTDKRRRD